MTFTQTTFLGASICSFNASVGWGNQASVLNVELVEDPDNGDSFDPPLVGSPVYFDYEGWKFGGLLQSYMKKYGQGGNPLISVQVQDPRNLLEGVQLILNDYSGEIFAIPNIYNIYGYLESTYGFGGSFVNDTGIPWKYVRNAFIAMQATWPMIFRGEYFRFYPFFNFNLLPDHYRVAGGSISVLDFVNDICSATASDYYINMAYEPAEGYANKIELYLVSRADELRTGAIEEFVEDVDGAVSKEQGYELRNETTTRFVVGGKVCQLYFQVQSGTENDVGDDEEHPKNIMYDNIIMPYWGTDCNGNLILQNHDGTFYLDGRELYLETGLPFVINYPSDEGEMRAALESQDTWESYLWYYNNVDGSIHNGKANACGILGTAFPSKEFEEYLDRLSAGGMVSFDKAIRPINVLGAGARFINSAIKRQESLIDAIYNFVSTYATQYYGRKFMVRIPFVLAKVVPDTNNQIVFSWEPTDGGYVEETDFGEMANRGLMPYNVEQFTLSDNRIQGYVKFTGLEAEEDHPWYKYRRTVNTNELSPDDFIVEYQEDLKASLNRIFVKCDLDPDLVFINKLALYSPRVVITLPGRVTTSRTMDDLTMWAWQLIINRLMNNPNGNVHPDFANNAQGIKNAHEIANKVINTFGGELNWFYDTLPSMMPELAVLPLQSNILRYGPWFTPRTSAGKVEYEVDDTLVPWDYGSYSVLNLVGQSKVNNVRVNQLQSERGTVEFPGVPSKQLGELLVSNGPAITDINVNVGEQGVTTTYRMSTWTYQFGSIHKYNINRFLQMGKMAQEQKRAFRKLFIQGSPVRTFITGNNILGKRWARRYGNSSSSNMLAGEVLVGGSEDSLIVKTSVAGIAGYRLSTQIDDDNYVDKAGISLDGVFVPYTTDPLAYSSGLSGYNYDSYLPHFEEPTAGATEPTVDNLNPFGSQGISMALKEGEKVPSTLDTEITEYDGHVKGVGLKAPIIVGGWGYDTDGKPVPVNPDDEDAFFTNYKTRADQWKVGPLDIRWDNDRKLWVTGDGSAINIKTLELTSGLIPGGNATAKEWGIKDDWEDGDSNPFVETPNDDIVVYDFLLAIGRQQYSGDKIIAGELTFSIVKDYDDNYTCNQSTGVDIDSNTLTFSTPPPIIGSTVTISSSSTVPEGLHIDTTYYVRSVVGYTCKLASSDSDDDIIDITSTGAGTLTMSKIPYIEGTKSLWVVINGQCNC